GKQGTAHDAIAIGRRTRAGAANWPCSRNGRQAVGTGAADHACKHDRFAVPPQCSGYTCRMSSPDSITTPAPREALRRACAYATVLLLAACASAPPSQPLPEPVPEPGVEVAPQSEVELLLDRAAALSDADQQARLLVQAATLLHEQGENPRA